MNFVQLSYRLIFLSYLCIIFVLPPSFADDATNLVHKNEFWSSVNDDDIKDLLFEESVDVLPVKKATTDVYFRLFTRFNPTQFQLLSTNNVKKLQLSNFNPNASTIFITHGWRGEPYSLSCTLIKDAYLQVSDLNVIIIDWSSVSNSLYVLAQSYVRQVGLEVSLMINFLVDNGMSTKKTTLIGHSLGAHVMGIAGYNSINKIAYVVGLDPAGPFFSDRGPGRRISSADGNYVEIIHTNAGLLGLKSSVGHRDFFPNGGRKQPGCKAPKIAACSHSRSYKIYAESVSSGGKNFFGKMCDSYINYLRNKCLDDVVVAIGNRKVQNDQRGDFYFLTNDAPPYSLGLCGAQLEQCTRS